MAVVCILCLPWVTSDHAEEPLVGDYNPNRREDSQLGIVCHGQSDREMILQNMTTTVSASHAASIHICFHPSINQFSSHSMGFLLQLLLAFFPPTNLSKIKAPRRIDRNFFSFGFNPFNRLGEPSEVNAMYSAECKIRYE